MTPSWRVARSEPLALERQESGERGERRVDPVDRGQLVGAHALRVQDALAPRALRDAFRRQAARQHDGRRVREDLHGAPSRRAAAVRREPALVRRAEDLEPDLHPREERVAASVGLRRGVERLDVARRELSLGPAGTSAGRPPRGRVDRHDVGVELVDQRADLLGAGVRPNRQRDPSLVHQDEVQAFRDADVDPERSHGRVRASVAGAPGSPADRSWSRRRAPAPPSSRAPRARARARRTPTRSGRRTRPWGSAGP